MRNIICPECDGKGQVLVGCEYFEFIYEGYGNIGERTEVIEVLDPCQNCSGHGVIGEEVERPRSPTKNRQIPIG